MTAIEEVSSAAFRARLSLLRLCSNGTRCQSLQNRGVRRDHVMIGCSPLAQTTTRAKRVTEV